MSTVNGFPIVRGSVSLPRIGNWHADLLVDAEGLGPGDSAEIDMGDGLVLVGTVVRGADVRKLSKVRIIGGAGGLSNLARPKAYLSPLLRVVAADLARDAGETLASDLGTAGTFALLPSWTTPHKPTGEVLAALVAAAPAGTVWRVRPDGTLWIGNETWPESTTAAVELEVMPEDDRALLGPYLPTLLPGTTFEERKVDYVCHRIEGFRVRTEVMFHDEARPASADRAKDSLTAVIKAIAGGTFHARWKYRVVKQSGDRKLVDCVPVEPNAGELPGLTNVPIKHGVPGLTVQLSPGATVMVGFENHDQRRPFVSEWDPGASVLGLTFETLTSKLGSDDASEPMIKGNAFAALWAAHVHPTPFGPTSPTPTVLTTALSVRHKLNG